jgi:hypothetical protein
MSDSVLFKKPTYPINQSLSDYLGRFDRISKVPIVYDDLLRFSGFINVYDMKIPYGLGFIIMNLKE